MRNVSTFDFRNQLAEYLDEVAELKAPLVISRFGSPVAVVYPYDETKFRVKPKDYFGFLGKGDSGEKFLAKVRRSSREKKYVKSFG